MQFELMYVIIFTDGILWLNLQNKCKIWAHQFEKPYFSPLSMVATMAEELGEVARVVNIIYGDKNKKDSETLKSLEEKNWET